MRIVEILVQTRRDFRALFECEHCKKTETKTGYDDFYFHQKVIPKMVCKFCGEKAPDTYRPLQTKYPDDMAV